MSSVKTCCLATVCFLLTGMIVQGDAAYQTTAPRKPHWTDHPVLKTNSSIKPPICTWYLTRSVEKAHTLGSRGMYTRRSSNYMLLDKAAVDSGTADQLLNYDVLDFNDGGIQNRPNSLQLETTRESRLCLLMLVNDPGFTFSTEATIRPPPGYTSLGPVRWNDTLGAIPSFEKHGMRMQHFSQGMTACKTLAAGIYDFPSPSMIGAEFQVQRYSLLFGEADGSSSPLPPMPPGWKGPAIKQQELCPDALHDMWVVDNHDASDPDNSGKKWRTWHPQKDYIYGCYYGHEHGTPGILAGYREKLDYTAWKNYRQDESHAGFKSYVLPVPDEDLNLIFNLHADTSDIGRVQKEFHTMVVALTQKNTGKLLFEMSCKASTGGSACDYEDPVTEGLPFFPVGNAESRRLIQDAYRGEPSSTVNHRKRLNCWNPDNFNPKLKFRNGLPEIGEYEGWFMKTQGEMCMSTPNLRNVAGPVFDIKDAQTGCADQDCINHVLLGRRAADGKTITSPNLGTNRRIGFRRLTIGPQQCMHTLPGPTADGYITFYTNPTCTELCSGPSSSCIRQSMHNSFKGFTIRGGFEVSDVHGHHMYELAAIDGNHKKGLTGIAEVEGGLSMAS